MGEIDLMVVQENQVICLTSIQGEIAPQTATPSQPQTTERHSTMHMYGMSQTINFQLKLENKDCKIIEFI